MNTTRPYRMAARAEAVRDTRARILDAAREAHLATYYDDFTLQHIADEAEVTVQTVLRHFGTKEDLIAAAFAELASDIFKQMDTVAVGDVRGAVEVLYARYEWMGDGNIRALAQEERVKPMAHYMATARSFHREWVERIFAPYLPPQGHPAREKRVLQLLVLCDVYTWKLLRRDHGADHETAVEAVLDLMAQLTRSTPEG